MKKIQKIALVAVFMMATFVLSYNTAIAGNFFSLFTTTASSDNEFGRFEAMGHFQGSIILSKTQLNLSEAKEICLGKKNSSGTKKLSGECTFTFNPSSYLYLYVIERNVDTYDSDEGGCKFEIKEYKIPKQEDYVVRIGDESGEG